ncbi:MAG: AbrB/MazE/SpoVT family DNA-binding domain-containing protein [Solirubrobacteraceae bacterium]
MDSSARITSKGQVTIPKGVRDALGYAKGMSFCSGSSGRVP